MLFCKHVCNNSQWVVVCTWQTLDCQRATLVFFIVETKIFSSVPDAEDISKGCRIFIYQRFCFICIQAASIVLDSFVAPVLIWVARYFVRCTSHIDSFSFLVHEHYNRNHLKFRCRKSSIFFFGIPNESLQEFHAAFETCRR